LPASPPKAFPAPDLVVTEADAAADELAALAAEEAADLADEPALEPADDAALMLAAATVVV